MVDSNVLSLLSKPWQKFLTKMTENKTIPISEWKEVHLLGYFCDRYEQHFQKKYALAFRGAPSKCNEIYMIKKTMAMLNTVSLSKVKDYIDWVWDRKIIPNRLQIRTIGFLTTPGFGNEFQAYYSKVNKIDASTQLPSNYLELAKLFDVSVTTYGDLAFVKMALDRSSTAQPAYRRFFDKLTEMGFDSEILSNL